MSAFRIKCETHLKDAWRRRESHTSFPLTSTSRNVKMEWDIAQRLTLNWFFCLFRCVRSISIGTICIRSDTSQSITHYTVWCQCRSTSIKIHVCIRKTVFGQFNLLEGMVNTTTVNYKIHNFCTACISRLNQSVASGKVLLELRERRNPHRQRKHRNLECE